MLNVHVSTIYTTLSVCLLIKRRFEIYIQTNEISLFVSYFIVECNVVFFFKKSENMGLIALIIPNKKHKPLYAQNVCLRVFSGLLCLDDHDKLYPEWNAFCIDNSCIVWGQHTYSFK